MHRLLPFLAFCLLFVMACNPAKRQAALGSVDELHRLMTGSFDSRAQAGADESYYAIALHMYPIWEDQEGKWLYVEQSLYDGQDAPYRQRVYKLEQGKKGEFLSRVYTLPNPDDFIGAYKTPAKFNDLKPEDLIEREGCAVFLTRDADGTYRGSTNKNDCQSSLRGASYATSRVSINQSFVQSWDQGFNAAGEQVWGATEGGYMFLKN